MLSNKNNIGLKTELSFQKRIEEIIDTVVLRDKYPTYIQIGDILPNYTYTRPDITFFYNGKLRICYLQQDLHKGGAQKDRFKLFYTWYLNYNLRGTVDGKSYCFYFFILDKNKGNLNTAYQELIRDGYIMSLSDNIKDILDNMQ